MVGATGATGGSEFGAGPESGGDRLIVLRHAKSAWPDGVLDHERPLAGRGRRDAPAAGRRLYETGYVPDLVVCSTARRARETWDLVATELFATEPDVTEPEAAEPDVVYEPRVYAAGASDLLRVLHEVLDDVPARGGRDGRDGPAPGRTVLLVGHQPGVQELVLSLAGGGDEQALARARTKFPTSAFAVLALPGTRAGGGAGLVPGAAVLTDFAVPRGPVPAARG
ncbi:SixA phosphatase family protein [Streptomyces sp. NPDC014646]|uniref:SixA phosphatase family protein n=1 Tax=Streptomyces sp. NPDC014646 TaxID=3364877 RepID=UPI0036FB1754